MNDPLVFELDARIVAMERALARAEARAKAAGDKIAAQFGAANRKTDAALAQSASRFAGFLNISGSGRFVIQNTANQFGDLAVQIAAGTSPLRAMSQQLPQMLGGFGALGGTLGIVAPLLGTIAAIGIPLASFFVGMAAGSQDAADKAQTLADKVKVLKDAVSAYSEAMKAQQIPLAELKERFGEYAAEVERALRLQTELRRQAASDALGAVTKDRGALSIGGGRNSQDLAKDIEEAIRLEERLSEVQRQAGDFSGSAVQIAALRKARDELQGMLTDLGPLPGEVARLAEAYGITKEQVSDLVVANRQLQEADSADARIAAAIRLRDLLVEVFGSAEAANKATGGLVGSLNDAIPAAAELAAQSAAIAPNLSSAAREAASLGAQLWESVKAYGEVVRQRRIAAAEFAPGRALRALPDERGSQRGAVSDAAAYRTTEQLKALGVNADGSLASGRRGGGGGGGGSALDAQQAADLAKAKSLFDSTRTAAEKYATELDTINRLKAAGLVDDETYRRGLADLQDKFLGIADSAQVVADAMSQAFENALDNPKQALEALGKQLVKMLIYMQLAQAFPKVFGSGGFVPLKIPGFASGGSHSGGLRIVGENGPEIEATGPSRIIPVPELASRMGRGDGGPVILIRNYTGAQVDQQSGTASDGRSLTELIIGTVSGETMKGRMDGASKARFGLRPARVQR